MDSPSTQGFEQDEFPSDYWFIEDGLNDGTWEVSDDASFTGENSLHLDNWSNDIEFNRDYLMSSTMDLSGDDIEEVRISYKWAYCFKGTSEDDETDDRLRISVSVSSSSSNTRLGCSESKPEPS